MNSLETPRYYGYDGHDEFDRIPVRRKKRTFAISAISAAALLVAAGGGAAAGVALKPDVTPAACVEALDNAQKGIDLQQRVISAMDSIIQRGASTASAIANGPEITNAGKALLDIVEPYHTAKDKCLAK